MLKPLTTQQLVELATSNAKASATLVASNPLPVGVSGLVPVAEPTPSAPPAPAAKGG